MADVVQKCIAANDIHNGYVVCYVDKLGNVEKLERRIVETPNVEAIEAKLTDRLDEVNFYNN